MVNVAETNRRKPADWNPSPDQVAQVLQALTNEAYPPQGRSGVGPVVRRSR